MVGSEKLIVFHVYHFLSKLNLFCHFIAQSFICIRYFHDYPMQAFIFTTLNSLVLLNFALSFLTLFCKGYINTLKAKSCSYKASDKRLSLNNISS